MYNVNYDDERFKQVENEKQSELDKYNQTYDNLINERNNFTNQQQQLVDQWENTQKDIANQNLQYQKDLIEQQRNKAEKEYQNAAESGEEESAEAESAEAGKNHCEGACLSECRHDQYRDR